MVQKIPGAMAYGSQTLHRAYSVSSVEGIELRLSDKYKPTSKVTLPLQYQQKEPQSLQNQFEYDFKAENNFLQWLEGVRRTEAEREEQKKQQRLGAEAAEAALQREDPEIDENASQSHPPNNDLMTQTNSVQRPLLPPVAASLGQDILQPVPLQNNNVTPASNKKVKTDDLLLDFADFENNASDPFEQTELETINDMEELRSVLANTITLPTATQDQVQMSSPPPSMEVEAQDATSSTTPSNVTTSDDSHQLTMETNSEQVSFKPNKPNPPVASTSTPGIPPPYTQQGPQSNGAIPNRTVTSSSSRLPPVRNDPFVSRSPLPPITSSRENSDISLASISSLGLGSEPSVGRQSPPPSYTPVDMSVPPSGPSSLPFDPPPQYPMDELEANFSSASLSRFTPLPPSSHQFTTGSTTTISVETPDPVYDAMSVEEKNFVNTIVGMGFPKSRTARAVKNIGNDDRQVVDLLCAIDVLCGQGFPEEKVELALNLQDNNQEKASAFLKLWQRFEELGFKSEDIKRELIVHGNNEEKVLDTLTR